MNVKQITQVKSCAKCGNQLIYERREGLTYHGKIDKREMTRHYFCIDCNSDCQVKWTTLHHWTHALRSSECGVDEEFPLIRVDKVSGEKSFRGPYIWSYFKVKSQVLEIIADSLGGSPCEFDAEGKLVQKEGHPR